MPWDDQYEHEAGRRVPAGVRASVLTFFWAIVVIVASRDAAPAGGCGTAGFGVRSLYWIGVPIAVYTIGQTIRARRGGRENAELVGHYLLATTMVVAGLILARGLATTSGFQSACGALGDPAVVDRIEPSHSATVGRWLIRGSVIASAASVMFNALALVTPSTWDCSRPPYARDTTAHRLLLPAMVAIGVAFALAAAAAFARARSSRVAVAMGLVAVAMVCVFLAFGIHFALPCD